MIHADFPDAVGIETEIVHTDTSLDYDQLAARIEQAGVSKQDALAILASVKRQQVIVRATVTIRTPKCEVKFTDHAHEKEDIVNKRSVNHTSYLENAPLCGIQSNLHVRHWSSVGSQRQKRK